MRGYLQDMCTRYARPSDAGRSYHMARSDRLDAQQQSDFRSFGAGRRRDQLLRYREGPTWPGSKIFDGIDMVAGAGFAWAGGGAAVYLKNERGVIVKLIATVDAH